MCIRFFFDITLSALTRMSAHTILGEFSTDCMCAYVIAAHNVRLLFKITINISKTSKWAQSMDDINADAILCEVDDNKNSANKIVIIFCFGFRILFIIHI